MNNNLEHTTLKGKVIPLKGLDSEEKELLEELRAFLKKSQDWSAYFNFKMQKIGEFYDRRGVDRSAVSESPLYQVAQDLGSRLAIAEGWIRAPNPKADYRQQLSRLITEKYHTRRGFCQETGISEDLLSHVLAGRKHLAIDTLTSALERIGYQIQIMPIGNAEK